MACLSAASDERSERSKWTRTTQKYRVGCGNFHVIIAVSSGREQWYMVECRVVPYLVHKKCTVRVRIVRVPGNPGYTKVQVRVSGYTK